MDLESFLAQVLNLIGTFSPQIVVILFLICVLGEGLGITVPYLLETVWLIAGYQFGRTVASSPYLALLLLTAQAGRHVGALLFFYLSRFTAGPLSKLTAHTRMKRFMDRSSHLIDRINVLSPFSVALGRLMGLRVPLTVILGAKRKLKVLILAIFLSSLAFDGTYVVVGAAMGATAVVSPVQAFLFFLGGLVLMYGVTFAFRWAVRRFLARRTASHEASPAENDAPRAAGDAAPPTKPAGPLPPPS